MSIDQDLSGDLVKVVQYTIVSVATAADDTARVLCKRPRTIAFADDMTAADFTAWILSLPEIKSSIRRHVWHCYKERFCGWDGDVDTDPQATENWQGEDLERRKRECFSSRFAKLLSNPKWHRVAFFVMSRFSPADIDWEEKQAHYLSNIADELRQLGGPKGCLDKPMSKKP